MQVFVDMSYYSFLTPMILPTTYHLIIFISYIHVFTQHLMHIVNLNNVYTVHESHNEKMSKPQNVCAKDGIFFHTIHSRQSTKRLVYVIFTLCQLKTEILFPATDKLIFLTAKMDNENHSLFLKHFSSRIPPCGCG